MLSGIQEEELLLVDQGDGHELLVKLMFLPRYFYTFFICCIFLCLDLCKLGRIQ